MESVSACDDNVAVPPLNYVYRGCFDADDVSSYFKSKNSQVG